VRFPSSAGFSLSVLALRDSRRVARRAATCTPSKPEYTAQRSRLCWYWPNPACRRLPNGDYMLSATPVTEGTIGDGNYCSFSDALVRSSNNAVPPLLGAGPPGEATANCRTVALYGPVSN
jgi:hypothetical protein